MAARTQQQRSSDQQSALQQADEAEIVLRYAVMWSKTIEIEVLQELLTTTDPFALQAKYKACRKFEDFARRFINKGKVAERKLQEE